MCSFGVSVIVSRLKKRTQRQTQSHPLHRHNASFYAEISLLLLSKPCPFFTHKGTLSFSYETFNYHSIAQCRSYFALHYLLHFCRNSPSIISMQSMQSEQESCFDSMTDLRFVGIGDPDKDEDYGGVFVGKGMNFCSGSNLHTLCTTKDACWRLMRKSLLHRRQKEAENITPASCQMSASRAVRRACAFFHSYKLPSSHSLSCAPSARDFLPPRTSKDTVPRRNKRLNRPCTFGMVKYECHRHEINMLGSVVLKLLHSSRW